MQKYDWSGLFQFLSQTPEGGLKKILVDGKSFTDVHLNMLLKIVRAGDESAFCDHAEKTDYPKIKFNPNETKLKDNFWTDCAKVCQARGLLSPAKSAA